MYGKVDTHVSSFSEYTNKRQPSTKHSSMLIKQLQRMTRYRCFLTWSLTRHRTNLRNRAFCTPDLYFHYKFALKLSLKLQSLKRARRSLHSLPRSRLLRSALLKNCDSCSSLSSVYLRVSFLRLSVSLSSVL